MTEPREQPVDSAAAPSVERSVLVPHGTPLPPPPPGVRHVSLPMVGVLIATDERRRRVDQFFHLPMIVLALAMLPLLAVEFFRRPEDWLRFVLNAGFAIIWAAFLVEFIVKVTIAECRIEYVRRNWLDLIIILVPVLRPLRAASIVRTARVIKLRGIGMKLVTILIGLEATERLLHRVGLKQRPEAKDPRSMTRHEMTREIHRLRDLAARWDRWYEDHEEHVARHGGPCHPEPRPRVVHDDEPPEVPPEVPPESPPEVPQEAAPAEPCPDAS